MKAAGRWFLGVLIIVGAASVIVWAIVYLKTKEVSPPTSYFRDSRPTAEEREILRASGLPSTISRIVSSRKEDSWSGDAWEAKIYCFDPVDVDQMKSRVGGDQWVVGLPKTGVSTLAPIPSDLVIDPSHPERYIHVPMSQPGVWAIIDLSKSVSYQLR